MTALATTVALAWLPRTDAGSDEVPAPRGPGAAAGAAGGPVVDLDEALLDRARRGDGRAFRTIFERHGAAIRRFLGDLMRDDAAADEATQETFVRVHRGMERIEDGAKLRPFLYGVARNVARERIRTVSRETPLDDDDHGGGHLAQLGAAPSPEALLLGAEADRVLAAAVAELPTERRAALLLRLDHDLGYPEIAEAMGWSLQKVKNEIHRARGKMRASILAYLGGEP